MTDDARRIVARSAVEKIELAISAYRDAVKDMKTIVPWDGAHHTLYADAGERTLRNMDRMLHEAKLAAGEFH